ncbi:hypothetical protein B0H12DRAFT_1138107 [Mycena haematopus]|nr:hypothetical protein B0H12DRAFT_1161821 [Mycena haematopus]KAJ7237888.1 hypothetical protein B0H12DRAFT_1138107 [Mycena haematopus]
MSDTQISISASTSSLSVHRTLRERCGFTLFISFAPAFPNIAPKGHLGPTAGNLPRRKRSSVVSIEQLLPAPVPVPAADRRTEYFA